MSEGKAFEHGWGATLVCEGGGKLCLSRGGGGLWDGSGFVGS